MAFGIPGSDRPIGGTEFLGRIQYDARTGLFQIVKRMQFPDGSWGDEKSEQFKNPTMLFDFGSLEVGYIKFAAPPVFLTVAYGKPIPDQPMETQQDTNGRARKTFLPGFRIKVCSTKTFGDANAYYFAHNARTVVDPMDVLNQQFETSPEAAQGLVPLVAVTGTTTTEIRTPQGTLRYLAPVFQIRSWHERPDVLGERMVPPPGSNGLHVPPAPPVPPVPPVVPVQAHVRSAPQTRTAPPQAKAQIPPDEMPF